MKEGSLIVLEGTVIKMSIVYDDLEKHINSNGYDIRTVGYDPYNAETFINRWTTENTPYGVEKVPQGSRTESVPLGELKKYAEDRKLIFDQEIMTFCMGHAITVTDNNGNSKLIKKKRAEKIDSVSAMLDAYVAFKANADYYE
jgi:phage terminase large subunit-like protein